MDTKGISIDLKAMKQIDDYIKKNPSATYTDVAKEIDWYFQPENSFHFSVWIVDYIHLSLAKNS